VVDQPDDRRPPGWVVSVVSAGERPVQVALAQAGLPLLWWVVVPEPDAGPAATTVLAFSDERHGHGRVLDAESARLAGVRRGAPGRCGPVVAGQRRRPPALRGPAARRRGIGGALVTEAFALQFAADGVRLHGDGRRTDDGEAWRAHLPGYLQQWFDPWSQRLPPMTPDG
jgi:GNAT superfamily N-acetyltransferase